MRRHLEQLCSDTGCAQMQGPGWGSRFMAVSVAIGMSAALGACYGGPMPPPESPETAEAVQDPASLSVASDAAADPVTSAPTADEVPILGAGSTNDTD